MMFVSGTLVFLFLTLPAFSQVNAIPRDSLDIPDAPMAVEGTLISTKGMMVQFVSHQGEWTSFFSMAGSEAIFLISGQIENVSEKPLSYVKFQCSSNTSDGERYPDHEGTMSLMGPRRLIPQPLTNTSLIVHQRKGQSGGGACAPHPRG